MSTDGLMKRRKKVDLSECRYQVVRRACKRLGWRRVNAESPPEGEEGATTRTCTNNWSLSWQDVGTVEPDFVRQMLPTQKVNHFPGMQDICLKCNLAKHLNFLKRAFPDEYMFHPESFVLPSDLAALRSYGASEAALPAPGKRKKRRRKRAEEKKVVEEGGFTLIVKPDNCCQGKGIFLTGSVDRVERAFNDGGREPLAVQRYLSDPYLINGFKFDLRVYALVLSVAPQPRVFVHREGLARFCTEPYAPPDRKNMSKQFMHLTNYAINKKNKGRFVSSGSKKSLNEAIRAGRLQQQEEADKEEDVAAVAGAAAKPEVKESSTEEVPVADAAAPAEANGDEQAEEGGQEQESKELEETADDIRRRVLAAQDGSKWSLTALMTRLAAEGCDTDALRRKIDDVVAKTVIAVHPNLMHQYRACSAANDPGLKCFEFLGVDIILDSALSPLLLEVNFSPNLHSDSVLDRVIKDQVVGDALALAGINAQTVNGGGGEGDAAKRDENWRAYEDAHMGDFVRVLPIYPDGGEEDARRARRFAEIEATRPKESLQKETAVMTARQKVAQEKRLKREAADLAWAQQRAKNEQANARRQRRLSERRVVRAASSPTPCGGRSRSSSAPVYGQPRKSSSAAPRSGSSGGGSSAIVATETTRDALDFMTSALSQASAAIESAASLQTLQKISQDQAIVKDLPRRLPANHARDASGPPLHSKLPHRARPARPFVALAQAHLRKGHHLQAPPSSTSAVNFVLSGTRVG